MQKSPVCCEYTSNLCAKPKGGLINSSLDHLAILFDYPSNDKFTTLNTLQNRPKSCDTVTARSPPSIPPKYKRQLTQQCFTPHITKYNNWLNERTLRHIQIRSDKDSRNMHQLVTNVLASEGNLVNNIGEFSEYHNILQDRKRELLHKQWADEVYEPLRKKIIAEMSTVDWKVLEARKREIHKQFLQYGNRRGHIFLDSFDPEDYYSMALSGHRPAPLRVHTKRLRDPLLQEGRQHCDEERTVLRCLTGSRYSDKDIEQVKLPLLPLVPLGRHGTHCGTWINMPLANVDGNLGTSRTKLKDLTNSGSLDLNSWIERSNEFQTLSPDFPVNEKPTQILSPCLEKDVNPLYPADSPKDELLVPRGTQKRDSICHGSSSDASIIESHSPLKDKHGTAVTFKDIDENA